MTEADKFEFSAIGYVDSCFKQKFTIPRQPGLVPEARAKLVLLPEYSHEEAIRGLEQYSHIWVLFVFHASQSTNKKLTVRPPRLGGKQRMGVFATRSNFRPNPIGQSVVKLDKVEKQQKQIVLHLSGVDILDKTPVLDIKPYLPFAESIPTASGGMAEKPPARKYAVKYTSKSRHQIEQASIALNINLMDLIDELLAYDPRPAFYEGRYSKDQFVTSLYDFDLTWTLQDREVIVTGFTKQV